MGIDLWNDHRQNNAVRTSYEGDVTNRHSEDLSEGIHLISVKIRRSDVAADDRHSSERFQVVVSTTLPV